MLLTNNRDLGIAILLLIAAILSMSLDITPLRTVLAPPLMARETFLITRDPGNLATDKKHFIKQDLRLLRHDRDSTLGREIIW